MKIQAGLIGYLLYIVASLGCEYEPQNILSFRIPKPETCLGSGL
jgi:hypothetical protein